MGALVPKTARRALRAMMVLALLAGLLGVTLPRGQALAAGNRISWAGGTWYLEGANYPWHGYGTDFGSNAWGATGVSNAASNAAVDADFAAMAAEGIHVTRWFVFADGRAGITFDGSGMPTGIDSSVFPDLDAAVQIAARHNIYLDLVLLDFSWMQDAQVSSGVQLGGHANVINTSAGQQDLINNVFTPVFKRYGSNPMIVSWEVMNEPEWAISDDGAVHTNISQPSTLANFQTFTSAVAAAVHANTKSYVTVGEASMKWDQQWKGLGLDYYEIHFYDWMQPFANTNLYGATASSLGLDAPVVVGEFPASGSTTATLQQYLDTWFNNGYAGAWSWSYKAVDANGTPSAAVMQPWGSNHASSITVTPAAGVPTYDHIFTILMENHSYSEVVGAPYISSLAATGASGGSYFGIEHPSLPNYLDLTSGSNDGITYDCTPPTSCPVNVSNIADRVEAAGLTWKSYAENAPGPCPLADSGEFVTKHVPFVYYSGIQTNSTRCDRVVPYSQLSTDLASTATTPNYVFITPNLIDDMHDGTVQQGDTWLSQNVPTILASPAFTTQKSLLVVVWDEDDQSANNQVAWIGVGYGVKTNYLSSATYNHYSYLRTIEASWGMPAITSNDGSASVMSDMFGSTTIPALSASAGANPTSGPAPLAVSLTGSPSGGAAPYTYSWDFGDGSAGSTSQNPSHVYSVAGSYTAKLTVTDSAGHSVTSNAPTITVSNAPLLVAASANPAAGDEPMTVAFTGAATGGTAPYTYAWSFGDGTSGTGATPSHTYNAAGSYTAKVTVSDANAQTANGQVTVVVSPALTVGVTASPQTVDVGDSVSFGGSPSGGLAPYSYSWNFGDGSAGSTAQNPSHVYSGAAMYTASLSVSDANGVKVTSNVLVTVHALPTVSAAASPNAGDAPVTVSLSASPSGGTTPYGYSWNFGDGSAGSTAQSPSHQYASAGSYSATVTLSDGQGHSAMATVGVVVSPALSVSAGASPTTGAAPLTVSLSASPSGGRTPYSYNWNFGDGSAAGTVQNPSHVYANAGTYTASVTVTDANGAKTTASAPPAYVSPAPLTATATLTPTTGDAPLTTVLSAQASGGVAPYTYAWDLGDGTTGALQSFGHTYGTGSYTVSVTVTDHAGKTASAAVHLTVYPPLNVTTSVTPTSGVAPLDAGFTATVTGGLAPYAFAWSFGDGASGAGSTASHSFGAGTFNATLVVRDAAGGTWSAVVATINASAPPAAAGGGTASGAPVPPAAATPSSPTVQATPSASATPTEATPGSASGAAPTSGSGSGPGLNGALVTVLGAVLASGLGGLLFVGWRRIRRL